MSELVEMINSVGFPIVATCMMAYLLLNEQKAHKEEMKELQKTIENNTLIITELKQLLVDISNMKGSDDIDDI